MGYAVDYNSAEKEPMPNRKRSEALPSLKSEPVLDLRRWRLKSGISLDQVSENTKIGVRYLQAIETGNFGELPGGIFTLSYLRQYAAAIGLDADRLVRHYEDQTNPQPADEQAARVNNEPKTLFSRLFRVPS